MYFNYELKCNPGQMPWLEFGNNFTAYTGI